MLRRILSSTSNVKHISSVLKNEPLPNLCLCFRSKLMFPIPQQLTGCNKFSTTSVILCDSTEVDAKKMERKENADENELPEKYRDVKPEKLRLKKIPFETSMRYMQSQAYKETYGDQPVWTMYRRNFKGQFAPRKTRKSCIRDNIVTTGSPCPICRDEYLVLDYRNVELLKQFISPYNGEILPTSVTGLCRKRHFELLVEMTKVMDYGTITFDVPFRTFDYEEYKNIVNTY